MDEDINVLVLVKNEERYMFIFTDCNESSLIKTLQRYAANPELSFSWLDASILISKLPNQ